MRSKTLKYLSAKLFVIVHHYQVCSAILWISVKNGATLSVVSIFKFVLQYLKYVLFFVLGQVAQAYQHLVVCMIGRKRAAKYQRVEFNHCVDYEKVHASLSNRHLKGDTLNGFVRCVLFKHFDTGSFTLRCGTKGSMRHSHVFEWI